MGDRLLAALVTPCSQSSQPAISRLLDDVLKANAINDALISTSMKVGLLEGSALMMRCRTKDSRLNVLRATVSLMDGSTKNVKIELEAPCEGIVVEGHGPPYPVAMIGKQVLLASSLDGFQLFGLIESRQIIRVFSETAPIEPETSSPAPTAEENAELLKNVQFVALSRTWRTVQFVSPLWGGQILRLTDPIA